MGMVKLNLTLLLLLTLSSCFQRKYADVQRAAATAETVIKEFSGVDFVTDISDTTAFIGWTHSEEIIGYRVYLQSGITAELYDTYYNGSTTALLTGLEPNTDYILMIVGYDENGTDYDGSLASFSTSLAPISPAEATLVYPASSTHYIRKPIISFSGMKIGDTLKVYNDSTCTSLVGQKVATTETVEITLDPLTAATSHYLYATSTSANIAGGESDCPNYYHLRYVVLECPSGYVMVPGNASLNSDDFCVMNNEARAWIDSDQDEVIDSGEYDLDGCKEAACTSENWGTSTYKPGSTGFGKGWRNLNFQNARAECRSLGTGYDLISNNEWMTIARDAEGMDANWSGGSVGDGCLYSGNTGATTTCSYNSGGITSGYLLTKSTLRLSNGNYIYDFSGNLGEWAGWFLSNGVEKKTHSCYQPYVEIPVFACDAFGLEEFSPTNTTYNTEQSYGKINATSSGYAIRGGRANGGDKAGVFALDFQVDKTKVVPNVGFRCVYHPDD